MKTKSGILLLALCISFSFISNGQDKANKNPVTLNDSVYLKAEKMPEFPGGITALIKYIYGNVKYPDDAKYYGYQGKVYVQFVVNTDGTISNVNVEHGVCSLLDEESIRVIKSMPAWIPGENEGNKIKVRLTFPVSFVLN